MIAIHIDIRLPFHMVASLPQSRKVVCRSLFDREYLVEVLKYWRGAMSNLGMQDCNTARKLSPERGILNVVQIEPKDDHEGEGDQHGDGAAARGHE